ncbi:MAG TPA: hypothetical protein VIF14_10295 [Alphaproteobacteria bacterium]|jgi:hypothetical protein
MSKDGDNGAEGRGGRGSTLAGVLVLVAVVVLGVWLADELAESVRYSKCAGARHRNCDQIDYRSAPPQQ